MRLFVATTFPETVIRTLNERVTAARNRFPAGSWTKPDTQHVTFAFLGEQPDDLDAKLIPKLEENLRDFRAFDARLCGCGFFPSARRARVGWIGLEPNEPFAAVADAVRSAVSQFGIETDRDRLKAHLTLVRIRDAWPPRSIEMFEKAFHSYASEPFRVDNVTLFESRLHSTGATHHVVKTFALG